ncbi:uncharacterized protein K489DRAFT_378275 [Dissoconium aciculare CBS 342.82]|uniref:Hydrophobic surface binding protein A n=1 Tax=Dissoconium aciculare CBS 342.82 TaxID=1314786 RepID=A0A6J3MDQ4_9PEZI|nr:uncharacterized protein K489DRAFT_378275 [Dissoconium aciculare CBS 342.82]KAF1825734.1 hypothetical protein K489DRAFT_378275 [Dissoconium aciculare CBS 342.82]
MRAFSVALSLVLSSAALIAAADVDVVISALNTLNADLKTLDTDLNKVKAGIFGIRDALQASVDTTVVDNDIIAANTAVANAAKFSASDSARIITVVDALAAQSNKTITTTIKQAPAFGGLAPVVLASLYQLKTDSNTLGFNFAFKLDQSAINQGVIDLTVIQQGFAAAIVAYGGTN